MPIVIPWIHFDRFAELGGMTVEEAQRLLDDYNHWLTGQASGMVALLNEVKRLEGKAKEKEEKE